jgi:hypothetical protein
VVSARHKQRPYLQGALCVLAVLALGPGRATAQEALHWSRVDQGAFQAINLYADTVTTWIENGQRYLLVHGNAWINQDAVNIRFADGLIRVPDGVSSSGPRSFLVYAEGGVSVSEGLRSQKAERGILQLSTREKINIRATGGHIAQVPSDSDPLVQRALAAWQADSAIPQPSPIQLTSARDAKTAQNGPGTVIGPGGAAVDVVQPPVPPPPTPTPDQPVPAVPSAPPIVGPRGQLIQPRTKPGLPPPPVVAPAAPSTPRQITILPRSLGQPMEFRSFALPGGENAIVVTSGVILNVVSPLDTVPVLDIEADHVVIWSRGNAQQVMSDMQVGQGQKHDTVEFYLAGNVEIRSQSKKEMRIIRCDEAYYDVKRHVALALKADVQIDDPRVPDSVHVSGEVVRQQNENLMDADKARISASRMPFDPGLYVYAQHASVEAEQVQRRTIFGLPFIDLKTGLPLTETQHYFRSENDLLYLEGVPIFYTPILNGDVEHPLGPLENISANYDHIFGMQLFTTWDVYELLGLTRIPDTNWRLFVDYLSLRGPALGTDFEFNNKSFLGIPGRYTGEVKAYGIYDTGMDQLGSTRGTEEIISSLPTGAGTFVPVNHPDGRGWFLTTFNGQDMPNGFSVQSQISVLSDQNFLEQYYSNVFQNGYDQETFLYLKQQQDFWAWTLLANPDLRPWVTQTEWLPRADFYGLGISLFDLFTYNIKANAGYARLRTTDVPPFAFEPTDANINTARGDLWQDISLPLHAGAFTFVPYGVLDLTYYSEDLAGDPRGRFYGAGGLRASFPLSRLYPGVQSELFNLDGIYHKITFTADYYNAYSDTPYTMLPQLDRLNDDISDLTLREMHLWQPLLNPSFATFLTTSPIFDPQAFAIRQMVLNQVDTRDTMEVLNLDVYQRWQTKRGFPGSEHVVDWMTLDLNASLYPRANRDDFGQLVGFMSYDWTWNIGDRTSLVSSGWMEPEPSGPRVFILGGNVNTSDNTNFYLGYRQLDPLESKSIIASITYAFSPKYAVTASADFDFGVHVQTYTLLFTRTGTDLQVSFGVNYNSILNNFGVVFNVVPTLLASRMHQQFGQGVAPTTSVGGR